MFPAGSLRSIAGKVLYSLSCVLAVVTLLVGYQGHQIFQAVASIGGSDAITSGPSVGAQNILLMGLESRTDWNGNILPPDVLAALHAGSTQGVENGVGGNATNTLILIHVYANGKKAVGFSIPRDDWVTYPQTYLGSTQGKIDNAYGYAMAEEENSLAGKGLSKDEVAFKGNEAGRAATVATVESLTGVHIDHFAEVNLDGFYELAKVLGGINVCLNHPVQYDSFSGFFAHHAGVQHLDAKGALAFVRQRHGLLNGDLDRTHRQQAFIDSVIHQLKADGVLSDITKIGSLLTTAKQYVITDKGWDLSQFALDMSAFTGRNLRFNTLPIVTFSTIAGQAANVIDPAAIQKTVQETFYPRPKSSATGSGSGQNGQNGQKVTDPDPAATTVQVYNGTTTPELATQVSAALVKEGYKQGTIGNTTIAQQSTEVLYGTGAATAAAAIAGQAGVTAQASVQVPAGTVKVLIGPGLNVSAITTSGTSPGTSPSTSPSATPSATNGAAGGTLKVPADGIPCVN